MPAAPPANRLQRLGTLNKSTLGQRRKPAQRSTVRQRTCPCTDPRIEDDGEGHMVCKICFTQISESNIVADVTFQEDSRGAATVQGSLISESARHAKPSAAQRRIGGGERNALQEIEANGRRTLGTLCPKLGIPETMSNQALRMYTLAVGHNFSAGRRTDEVIGVCLYAACRRQKDNSVLLIDIAELLNINVFRLGEVYKSMCAELYLDPSGGVGTQYLVEVESLVMKYCRRLEFEPAPQATRLVAEDALKIIRRMKRDWISTGRHPAGLCGAAIILAARMNNFRRSVREVVYVAKIADMTLTKRVEEFRRTKSAALTVDQFRQYGVRLKHQHDPPALHTSQLKEQKFEERKRKRQAASEARDVIEISDDGSRASSRESSVTTPSPAPEEDSRRKHRRTSKKQSVTAAPTQQEPRRDADGFVIPPLPVDPSIGSEDEQPEKPKRGRRWKTPPEPIVITDEELATEAELELDINDALNDQEIVDSRNELEKAKDEERAKALAEQQKKDDAEKTRSRREAEGVTWLDGNELSSREEIAAEDLQAMFADDPEVLNCELSPAEQQIKEQIWIKHNEDWLRDQHEKALRIAIAGATRNAKSGKKKNKTGKRRRKGRMGDGTTLAEATTPIETPADANVAMLEARAPSGYSKFINYETLMKVYAQNSSSPSASASRRSTTLSANGTSEDHTPPTEGRADVRDGESASPTPAPRTQTVRLQSPPVTQQIDAAVTSSVSPVPRPTERTAPLSPPETQMQASAGAEEHESEGDPDDYVQDKLDYGSQEGTPFGWDSDDDREDIGEEDYQRALDPTGDFAMEDTFGEDYY